MGKIGGKAGKRGASWGKGLWERGVPRSGAGQRKERRRSSEKEVNQESQGRQNMYVSPLATWLHGSGATDWRHESRHARESNNTDSNHPLGIE